MSTVALAVCVLAARSYGRLGHAEAVQLSIPTSAVPAFAKKYIDIFGQRGYRHDPQDRGGEYRSVLGLPGGTSSPHYKAIGAHRGIKPAGSLHARTGGRVRGKGLWLVGCCRWRL